ncbi:MAG: hypothetical protein ACE5GX_16530 [Thermoanaerobaculia bacterium]
MTSSTAMSRVLLVRHGQASAGSADYDRLSELGERQSRLLGRHWAGHGLELDRVGASHLPSADLVTSV